MKRIEKIFKENRGLMVELSNILENSPSNIKATISRDSESITFKSKKRMHKGLIELGAIDENEFSPITLFQEGIENK